MATCNCELQCRRWNAASGVCETCGDKIPPGHYGAKPEREALAQATIDDAKLAIDPAAFDNAYRGRFTGGTLSEKKLKLHLLEQRTQLLALVIRHEAEINAAINECDAAVGDTDAPNYMWKLLDSIRQARRALG